MEFYQRGASSPIAEHPTPRLIGSAAHRRSCSGREEGSFEELCPPIPRRVFGTWLSLAASLMLMTIAGICTACWGFCLFARKFLSPCATALGGRAGLVTSPCSPLRVQGHRAAQQSVLRDMDRCLLMSPCSPLPTLLRASCTLWTRCLATAPLTVQPQGIWGAGVAKVPVFLSMGWSEREGS